MKRNFYIIEASTPKDGVVIPTVRQSELESIKTYMFMEGISLLDRLKEKELPLNLYYSPNFRECQTLYDFVEPQSYILIISSKVRKVFESVGIDNAEYIPVRLVNHDNEVTSEDYCIANVLGGEDIIDLKRSNVVWDSIIKDQISDINKLVVDYKGVDPNAKLFRASKMLITYIVDQEVAEALKEAGITGYGLWEADGWNGLNI